MINLILLNSYVQIYRAQSYKSVDRLGYKNFIPKVATDFE